jgi:hypothetical protein
MEFPETSILLDRKCYRLDCINEIGYCWGVAPGQQGALSLVVVKNSNKNKWGRNLQSYLSTRTEKKLTVVFKY